MRKVFEYNQYSSENLKDYDLAIIAPVFNRKKITLNYVNQLKTQSFQNFILILIDNGEDRTYEDAISILNNIIVLKGKSDLWWGNSLQYGVDFLKQCKTNDQLIVHINNDDTVFDNKFLKTGMELIKSVGGLVCSQAVSNKDVNRINKGICIVWKDLNFNPWSEGRELNCVSTRGIFIKFIDILRVGEFRDRILPHYLSDFEFTVRANQRGLKLSCPDDLRLTSLTDETGIHKMKELDIFKIWGHVFDKRNALNPMIYMKFSILRAPLKYKLLHIFKYSYMLFKIIVKSLLITLRVYKTKA